MSAENQVKSDIQYIRDVVESANAFPSSTPAVLYLWAVIVFTGFLMMDYNMAWFWPIGGLGGGLVSIWLNRRSAETRGQVDPALVRRANLHWALGLGGGILLSLPLQITGAVSEAVNGQIALLIIAICYFLAGVHLDRFMLWLGGLAVGAYAATFLIDEMIWAIPGTIIAIGLIMAGMQQSRS